MSGTIKSDPLFVGLTRPTLIFGVSLQFALLNMMICVSVFIQTTNFKIIVLAIALHGVGYYLCFREPRFMELYMNKFARCNKCPNKSYYGANSYGL